MDAGGWECDILPTAAGDLEVTFLGHGSLLLTWSGVRIYVDPFSRVADYAPLPKADLILLTHEHPDHLDAVALGHVRTPATAVVLTAACAERVPAGIVLRNGEQCELRGLTVRAVPAYNREHRRDNGQPFHLPGVGNGYVLTMGALRMYIAGDTEDIPEMAQLGPIDVAFLPMNLPYTMTPEMVARSARVVRPRVLYPYHYGSTDPQLLVDLLRGEPGIEVRVRKMA